MEAAGLSECHGGQMAAKRKISLVLADVDGTLVNEEMERFILDASD